MRVDSYLQINKRKLKMLSKNRLLTCLILTLLSSSSALFAQSTDIVFVDQQIVKFGTPFVTSFEFPSKEYLMECFQKSGFSQFATLEWTYNNQTFKAEAGGTRWTMFVQTGAPVTMGIAQFIDTKGQLTFTNLDKNADLYVTCIYDLAPAFSLTR